MGDLWGDPRPINTTTSTTALPTTTSWAPVNPPLNKCNYYIVNQSSVEFLDFGNPYGGIPQNLLINAVCWLVLVLSFAILRRAAGNYGRLALIRHNTLILHTVGPHTLTGLCWMLGCLLQSYFCWHRPRLFILKSIECFHFHPGLKRDADCRPVSALCSNDIIAGHRPDIKNNVAALIRKDDDESRWTEIFFSQQDDEGGGGEEEGDRLETMADTQDTDSITTADYNEVDRGICSWLTSIFTLSDDMILRKCGIDAIQYIRFQRHLIIFVTIITVICLTIILPINFTMGNVQGGPSSFGHTTISNLDATTDVLWVHIVIGILFMPCGIFIMRKFSVSLRMEFEEENSVRKDSKITADTFHLRPFTLSIYFMKSDPASFQIISISPDRPFYFSSVRCDVWCLSLAAVPALSCWTGCREITAKRTTSSDISTRRIRPVR